MKTIYNTTRTRNNGSDEYEITIRTTKPNELLSGVSLIIIDAACTRYTVIISVGGFMNGDTTSHTIYELPNGVGYVTDCVAGLNGTPVWSYVPGNSFDAICDAIDAAIATFEH